MSDRVSLARQIEADWQEYFSREGTTFFQRLLMIHRRVFISRAVRYWFNKVFPQSGIFIEAGAGTSESSGRIDASDRKLVAFDVCNFVLANLNVLPGKVQGDIFRLPFPDDSIDGIWNLGVMEHFTDQQIHDILSEFNRVLIPEGRILLMWPPWFAPYELILNSIAWFLKAFFRKEVSFFPDEINRFTTRARLESFLTNAGFRPQRAAFSWRDIYSYIVVVAQTAPAGTSES